MNKAVAGFHMLSILSVVDGRSHTQEEKVIHQYVNENFNQEINPEKESDILQTLPREDFPIHFNNAMNDFYMDSTFDERVHFLDLAVKLVIADKVVSHSENLFLNELFNAWEANYTL